MKSGQATRKETFLGGIVVLLSVDDCAVLVWAHLLVDTKKPVTPNAAQNHRLGREIAESRYTRAVGALFVSPALQRGVEIAVVK